MGKMDSEKCSPPSDDTGFGNRIEGWREMRSKASSGRKLEQKKKERKRMADLMADLQNVVAPEYADKHMSRCQLLDMTVQMMENHVFGDPTQMQLYLQDHLPLHVFEGTGLIIDLSATVLFALPSCKNVFGLTQDCVRGKSILQLVHETDRLKFIHEFSQIRHEKRQFDCMLAKFKIDEQSETFPLDPLPPPTCYARHRLSLSGQIVIGMVCFLLFVSPEEPTPQQPTLGSRWCDFTLSGRIPSYDVFSLQQVDSTYVISLAANSTGNRFGYGSLEANPRTPGVLEMMHPEDIPYTSTVSLQAYATKQIMLVSPRFLTGHKTWIRTKSYGVYCIHKGTGQVTHIFSKSVVDDERGAVWEPPLDPSNHKLMGPGSLAYDSEEELIKLVQQLTIHSRNRFEREHSKMNIEEEEAVLKELTQWQSAISNRPTKSTDRPQNTDPSHAGQPDLSDLAMIGARSGNLGAIGRLQNLPGHVGFDWDFILRLLNDPQMVLDPSLSLPPPSNNNTPH